MRGRKSTTVAPRRARAQADKSPNLQAKAPRGRAAASKTVEAANVVFAKRRRRRQPRKAANRGLDARVHVVRAATSRRNRPIRPRRNPCFTRLNGNTRRTMSCWASVQSVGCHRLAWSMNRAFGWRLSCDQDVVMGQGKKEDTAHPSMRFVDDEAGCGHHPGVESPGEGILAKGRRPGFLVMVNHHELAAHEIIATFAVWMKCRLSRRWTRRNAAPWKP